MIASPEPAFIPRSCLWQKFRRDFEDVVMASTRYKYKGQSSLRQSYGLRQFRRRTMRSQTLLGAADAIEDAERCTVLVPCRSGGEFQGRRMAAREVILLPFTSGVGIVTVVPAWHGWGIREQPLHWQ